MKRILSLSVLAALAASVLFIACPSQKGDINVGVILPLTGDAALYGKEGLNGMQMAVDEVNQKGGIKGRPIKLVVEDDKGTPADGVSALNKLIATNTGMKVVLGGAFSQVAAALIPICDAKGVVLFSPYASNPDLIKPNQNFFRNWPSDAAEGSQMAKYAYENLSLRKVAILSSSTDYGVGLRRVFEQQYKAMGGEIPAVEEFGKDATDFRTQLAKIKPTDPQALYMIGWYKDFALILRQATELGMKVQYLSCVTFNQPEILKLAGSAAEGVIYSQPSYSADSREPVVAGFVAAYKARFNNAPGIYAAQGYDAVNLVAKALNEGTSLEAIKKGLYAIKDFPGVTGLTTFDQNGDVQKPVQFWQVKGGKFVQIEG